MKEILKILLIGVLATASVAQAAPFALEQGLQEKFMESRLVLRELKAKLRGGSVVADELQRLRSIGEEIRVDHLLLQERFSLRSERVAEMGSRAAERQRAMEARYRQALEDFLQRFEALPEPEDLAPADIDSLLDLLEKILPPRNRPLLGSLPYKHLAYPPRSPVTEPLIAPAYRDGDKTVYPADTEPSAAAGISAEIATLAESLDWKPVAIYEWVQQNVASEWYWGSMKGAEETLRQRSGNDADQAALLTALLRAADFPTRFVRGTIEFFPGMEKVKNLTALDDPFKIAAFFQKAGVPCEPVLVGGRIVNFRIEHVWVETQVPYANYRGAVLDGHGKAWMALDTHIKPAMYDRDSAEDLPDDFPLAELRDDYLAAMKSDTPMEHLRGSLEAHLQAGFGATGYQDHLASATPVHQGLNILPSSLQFRQVAVTGEHAELPPELRHTVTFVATSSRGAELFRFTLDASQLSNRRISLTYEPETIEDHQIIDSYGGLDNTPAYLVRLRPVLKVDGVRQVVARDGLPMGETYTLRTELGSPNGTESVTDHHVVGNLAVIGLAAQQALPPSELSPEEMDAERILHKEALAYIGRWNAAEEELAALLKLAMVRPVPTVVTLGGVIDVTYLFDTPHGFTWKGVFIDAGLRRVETVAAAAREEGEKPFMRLSALEGSVLENRLFEDAFGVASVSTAKLLALAPENLVTLLTLDRDNVDALLPGLDLAGNVKDDIANAVNQGLVVTVPEREMAYESWVGTGYIKENPTSGEAGYMLSGMLAGGMTAWDVGAWNESVTASLIAKILEHPYTGKPNTDPSAADSIERISATDLQKGKVGEELREALQVRVLDKEGKAVEGAEVVFSELAGGGSFDGGVTEINVTTDSRGIAAAALTLGIHTGYNPTYWQQTGKSYALQVGENLVTASLTTISRPSVTFTAFGHPGEPATILFRSPDRLEDEILNYAGPVVAFVGDADGNPLANVTLDFEAESPQPKDAGQGCPIDPNAPSAELTLEAACADLNPTYGQCGELASSALQGTSNTDGLIWVGVILGDQPSAAYPVRASYAKEDDPTGEGAISATITRLTRDFGSCGEGAPETVLFLNQTNNEVDEAGRGISARKVGDTFTFRVKTHVLSEGEKTATEAFTCGGEQQSCDKVVGDSTFSVEHLDDLTVEYYAYSENGVVGERLGTATPLGGGLYEGQVTLGDEPGINAIYVKATTSKTVTRSQNGCDGCSTGPVELHLSKDGLIGLFGVDFGMPERYMVVVDNEGQVVVDTPLDFSILPASYQAGSAQLLIYKDYQLVAVLPTEKSGEASATLARGFQFEPGSNYKAQVVLNYGWQSAVWSEKIPLHPYNFPLVPDYNHNRRIDDEDRLRAAKGDTYYFWINDDDDFGETGGSDVPIALDDLSQNTNAQDSMVNGVRDLIDFFPMHLDLQSLFKVFSPSWHTYRVRNDDFALNFLYSDLDAENAGDYLTDVHLARDLGDERVEMVSKLSASMAGQFDTNLSSSYLGQISDSGKGVLLVEGIRKTKKPLFLDIYDDNGEKVFSCGLSVSLDGVEQMYRAINLIEAAGGPPAADLPDGAKFGGVSSRLDEPSNFPDSETDDKTSFVFLHGYNVNGEEARGWHAEIFKRMYWTGSIAKFWGVSWFGFESQNSIATPNFHINVQHAIETGSWLNNILKANITQGDITLVAHSLGNAVVASMINDHYAEEDETWPAPIKNVFMLDAAIAMEAFDGAIPEDDNMKHPRWWDFDNQKARYDEKLWASKWYRLFDDNDPDTFTDAREKLTWLDRFGLLSDICTSSINGKPKINCFNFYSSGEEVLATHTDPGTFWDEDPNYLEMVWGPGRYAFVLQERLKGRVKSTWMAILQGVYDKNEREARDVYVAGSPYGGWGFNLEDSSYARVTDPLTEEKAPTYPSLANSIPENQLKSRPFFKIESEFDGLLGEGTVSQLDNVRRDKLISEAIPALTLPAGGPGGELIYTENVFFDRENVINMQAVFKKDGKWPLSREDDPSWLHNDMRKIAYVYMYQLFESMVK